MGNELSMSSYDNLLYNRYNQIVLFLQCFRTYQEELITRDQISNVTEELVMTHFAIFEGTINGFTTYKKDYVASCVTFTSQERVPAGRNYNVTKHVSVEKVIHDLNTLFQPSMYLNAMDASKVMVYVHNSNQERQ